MADKKVERSGMVNRITPTQKMTAALSDPGTVNVADTSRDKNKAALVDKYREREQKWRREQSLHAQQTQGRGSIENPAAEEEPEDTDGIPEGFPPATVKPDRPPGKEGAPKGGAL